MVVAPIRPVVAAPGVSTGVQQNHEFSIVPRRRDLGLAIAHQSETSRAPPFTSIILTMCHAPIPSPSSIMNQAIDDYLAMRAIDAELIPPANHHAMPVTTLPPN
jgi:hypothetical protein